MTAIRLMILLMASLLPIAFSQGTAQKEAQPSGISQVIANRSGASACVGVIIQLRSKSFPAEVPSSSIEIMEAKHGRKLNDLMDWQVDQSGKRMEIKFRPGMGGFGSGNRVEVRIRGDIIKPKVEGSLIWVIDTDPL